MNLNHQIMETFKDCVNEDDKVIVNSDVHKFIEDIKKTYQFDILKQITAVDKNDYNIELIYHLYSTKNEEELLISKTVKGEAESIVDLFPSAKADENEIYDMFGINFIGNEDLKRLYMPENWSGHPLKKDYKEDDERLNWNDAPDA